MATAEPHFTKSSASKFSFSALLFPTLVFGTCTPISLVLSIPLNFCHNLGNGVVPTCSLHTTVLMHRARSSVNFGHQARVLSH